ncbi:MAG: IS1182 family transposase [Anaerolineae bacterium]|nr:IS1182 family transposase [Anaerolineae bacterium]
MSLKMSPILEVPELTAQIAWAAFPNGNNYMQMRDELGVFYADHQFVDLFSYTGQPAIAPWRLALVTLMQFAENLTDRQAADAVRGRIDWKYALGLEMTDPGFHYSVLSEFRGRLIEGGQEELLLQGMLDCFKEKQLLNARGKQRTDSTHILMAVRELNRLELVGETLYHTLNVVAEVAPVWLQQQITPDWFKRYGQRMCEARLPDKDVDRDEFALVIGYDGQHLLEQLYATPDELAYLRTLPAVQTLRQIWLQQYCWQNGELQWRKRHEHGMPPAAITLISPYDLDARYSEKRGMSWLGYKVHLTETCDEDDVHLITHVETTSADVPDNHVVEPIHAALAERDLLPDLHLVDAGYPDGENLVDSQTDYQVTLYGPVRPDNSWQARAQNGYGASHFQIDWDIPRATCPQGKTSYHGKAGLDPSKRPITRFVFREVDCAMCQAKALCTTGKARYLTLLPQAQHATLQTARQRQRTEAFKETYNRRAGVEGTISQAVQALTMRRSRYRGEAKTHLQHVATAAAMNLMRVINWLNGLPLSETRKSRFAQLAPA